jgi:glycosyltransferase involved in cell wall biosynthesis
VSAAPRPRVAIVIPVFNERESLPLVVGAIARELVDEIVVVDNGSTDGTGAIAAGLPVRLVRESRRGYGSACLAGVRALSARPPEVLVFLDGDYSDHPEQLPRLLEGIAAGADLVVGSRMLGQREPGALLPQARFGNALACLLIRLLYGHRYTDLGPFRAIRWAAYERLTRTFRLDSGEVKASPGLVAEAPVFLPALWRLEDHGHGLRHARRLENPLTIAKMRDRRRAEEAERTPRSGPLTRSG